jgi:hypothetical protein
MPAPTVMSTIAARTTRNAPPIAARVWTDTPSLVVRSPSTSHSTPARSDP